MGEKKGANIWQTVLWKQFVQAEKKCLHDNASFGDTQRWIQVLINAQEDTLNCKNAQHLLQYNHMYSAKNQTQIWQK